MLKWFAGATVVGAIALVSQPANAQSCALLPVVGDTGTRVEKTVSVPGTGITRDNWNTDFNAARENRSFVATITPKNGGVYSVLMNLKYPDDSVDTVFKEKVDLTERRPFTIRGTSRINERPYQVNLSIGGIEAVGNAYIASVTGCQ